MNLEHLKKLIRMEGYPGANYVIRPDGKRKKITPELKEEIKEAKIDLLKWFIPLILTVLISNIAILIALFK